MEEVLSFHLLRSFPLAEQSWGGLLLRNRQIGLFLITIRTNRIGSLCGSEWLIENQHRALWQKILTDLNMGNICGEEFGRIGKAFSPIIFLKFSTGPLPVVSTSSLRILSACKILMSFGWTRKKFSFMYRVVHNYLAKRQWVHRSLGSQRDVRLWHKGHLTGKCG